MARGLKRRSTNGGRGQAHVGAHFQVAGLGRPMGHRWSHKISTVHKPDRAKQKGLGTGECAAGSGGARTKLKGQRAKRELPPNNESSQTPHKHSGLRVEYQP
eukprot:765611-Karenia_brevis.AAC.2